MKSPLASPLRSSALRNPIRSTGRGEVSLFTPTTLTPYVWYDVNLTGTSTTISDSSGNGRANATYGAAAASPLFLPYTGTPYVHLEAASAGTNSISCTAPANTASYSALPLGGGAASTGAAAPGAFAFTTAGDWLSITLLDAGAVAVAQFVAADSTQTGVTGPFGVVWTINRGTAGRKTVLVFERSLALFGVDDIINVPAAAVPPMTATSPFTWVAVARLWATQTANADIFGKHGGYSGGTMPGAGLGTRLSTSLGSRLKDGTVGQILDVGAFTSGARSLAAITVSATTFTGYINNTAGTPTARTVGDMTNAIQPIIGRTTGTAVYSEMAFEALLTFDRTLSAGELAQLVTYYKGGL